MPACHRKGASHIRLAVVNALRPMAAIYGRAGSATRVVQADGAGGLLPGFIEIYIERNLGGKLKIK